MQLSKTVEMQKFITAIRRPVAVRTSLHWILLSAFVVLFLAPIFARADSSCTYCGSWESTDALHSVRNEPIRPTAITETSISLPLCTALKVERVYLADKVYGYTPPESSTVKSVTAIFRSDQEPLCENRFPELAKGAAIKLELRPRGLEGWEQLVITIYPLSVIDDIIRSAEALEEIPNQPGNKQVTKKYPAPTLTRKWFFMREGHSPCDEGTTLGEALCSNLRR